MSTKIKKKGITKIDRAAAVNAAKSYHAEMLTIQEKEAAMSKAIQKAKDKYELSIASAKDLQEEAAEVLEAYAEQTRDEWEGKSIVLNGVCLGFRTGKKAVQLLNGITAEAAVDSLKTAGLKRFVRTKEELDKPALVKEEKEQVVNQLAEAGIGFGQSETFFVELEK